MSVPTDQIPLSKRTVCRLSGYSLIRQLAWLVKQQSLIYIFYELLLVKAKVPQMPSMTLGLSLAELAATAAGKDRNNQDNAQDCQNKSIFHDFIPVIYYTKCRPECQHKKPRNGPFCRRFGKNPPG
jgi:hypothetical protein